MTWQRHGGETERTPEEIRVERLSAFLDRELTAEESAAVEADLAADASMRDELEELRGVQQLLASLGEVRAPRPFTLEAPPARASMVRRLGFGRLEWAMRVGTAISGLAFLVAVAAPAGGGAIPAAGVAADGSTTALEARTTAEDAPGGGDAATTMVAPDAPTSDGGAAENAAGGALAAPAEDDDAAAGGGSGSPAGADGAAQAPPPDGGGAAGGGFEADRVGKDPTDATGESTLAAPQREAIGASQPPPADLRSDGPGGVELSLLVVTLLLAALSSLPVLQRRRQSEGGHT